jgi:mycothiol synthase
LRTWLPDRSVGVCLSLIEGFPAVNSPRAALSWRPLGRSDLPAVTDLARRCLSADGGQPYAADPGFVSQRYPPGSDTCAAWDGARIVCVSSLRRLLPGAGGGQAAAVTTGLVHPEWRRLGVGGAAFDWAADKAGGGRLAAETELLSDGADALYLSKGLSRVFAEDVMRLAGPARVAPPRASDGLTMSEWGQAGPARFYEVYQAAFRDRPGFPGWAQDRWVEWIGDDEDFRPRWTLLATLDGADVGFIVADAAGWIVQMGVVPAARGQDIGARMIAAVVGRMRRAGHTTITLNVNVNNPHAAALYARLGFARTGGRARYLAGRCRVGPAGLGQSPS